LCSFGQVELIILQSVTMTSLVVIPQKKGKLQGWLRHLVEWRKSLQWCCHSRSSSCWNARNSRCS